MDGRPRKLDTFQERTLKVSLFVSRSTQIIKEKDLAEGYQLSPSTLRRYYSDEYRALSQRLATDKYRHLKAMGGLRSNTCPTCRKANKRHERCLDCGILIHPTAYFAHSGSPDMIRCYSCVACQERIETYQRKPSWWNARYSRPAAVV